MTAVLDEFAASGLALDRLPGNTAKLRLALDLAASLDPATRLRVLDVGCVGVSPLSLWETFVPLADRFELTGVDVVAVDRAAARGAELGLRFTARHGSAVALAEIFGEGAFDAVVSTQVLEHVRDWRAAVAQLAAVVRPGGRVYVTCDSGDLRRARLERIRLAAKRGYALALERYPELDRIGARLVSGEWERGPTRTELGDAAREAGLEVERIGSYGLRDVKRAQRPAGSETRRLWLALEEALAVEAGSALDPSPYTLLYLRARRVYGTVRGGQRECGEDCQSSSSP